MALITPPTASAIYNEAGHNTDTDGSASGLTPLHFGRSTDAEVLTLITSEILPTVQRRVEAEADEAAYPYDFPLSLAVWQAARPTFDVTQIGEEIANQEAGFQDAERQMAAARLLRRIETANEFWERRAERLEASAEESLASAKMRVQQTIKRTVDAQGQGRAGFAITTVNVTPVLPLTEFDGIDGYGSGYFLP